MSLSEKIHGQDLFDQASIDAAFNRYKKYTIDAIKQTNALKAAIVNLNHAFESGESGKYTRALRLMNKELKKLQKENAKLRKEQERLNKALVKQKALVTKLKAKLKGLGAQQTKTTKATKLFGAALRGLGLASIGYMILELGKNIYNTAKKLDTIKLTLGKVTDTNYELARSYEFLTKISEKFGLSILKSSSKFATFRASAKQSNFTLKETMDIFETFSNAGASLGKTSADLDRIFLALEQMMSKGRVSSEELRRQLGEVLPGAVSIMAKSMKVSTQELERMLKAGEVLAADVLPKFAEEVKKTFSLDNTERIETMASAQERFLNSWVELVRSISEDNSVLKNLVDGVLNELTKALKGITKTLRALSSKELQGDLAHILGTLKEIPKTLKSIGEGIAWLMSFTPRGEKKSNV